MITENSESPAASVSNDSLSHSADGEWSQKLQRQFAMLKSPDSLSTRLHHLWNCTQSGFAFTHQRTHDQDVYAISPTKEPSSTFQLVEGTKDNQKAFNLLTPDGTMSIGSNDRGQDYFIVSSANGQHPDSSWWKKMGHHTRNMASGLKSTSLKSPTIQNALGTLLTCSVALSGAVYQNNISLDTAPVTINVTSTYTPSPLPANTLQEINYEDRDSGVPDTEKQFDFCTLPSPEDSDKVNLVMAGEKVPTEILFQGNAEAINYMKINNDLIVERNSGDHKNHAQITLVPVGYDSNEIPGKMNYLIDGLENSFNGLPIDFSYLTSPVPIGIQHVQRFATLTNYGEADLLKGRLGQIAPVDRLLIVFKSDQYMGSGSSSSVIAGDSDFAYFLATHELGHTFGLSDGYMRYMPPDEILDSTSFFTSTATLSPKVKKHFDDLKPPIYNTSMRCFDWPIYRIYSPNSTEMTKGGTVDKLFIDPNKPNKFFNPLEKEIIRDSVAQMIEER